MSTARSIRLGSGLWFAGTIVSNPVDQTLLVDTGQLQAGSYLMSVQGGGNVAWTYDVQHRDPTNAFNQHAQRRYPAAGNEDFILAGTFDLATNERLRCILQGTIAGTVQLSIWAQLVL